ncbi:hypothetical protein HII36_04555 [Nonomuraea sp. NN258]|uniref:hypothetical protein n=1 Tax=Nonomuraea antri TaxID=2730852 RepID=UPI0015686BB5|nr:hypothetical protein [Nonomuraea antri]NRQ31107.1 hypothetical protein [Nonomuraea antri]
MILIPLACSSNAAAAARELATRDPKVLGLTASRLNPDVPAASSADQDRWNFGYEIPNMKALAEGEEIQAPPVAALLAPGLRIVRGTDPRRLTSGETPDPGARPGDGRRRERRRRRS